MWKDFKPSLNTKLVWSLIAVFAAADALGLKTEGIAFSAHAFRSDIATVIILLTLSALCTFFRRYESIAEMLHIGAAFLIFTAIAVVSSYLIAAHQTRPLVDASLSGADRALGLDWPASYQWVMAHPLAHQALWFGYSSVTIQIIALLLILAYRGQNARSREMLWLFVVSCAICVLLSGVWPAAGAFAYYHAEPDNAYVRAFMALRSGTLKSIVNASDVQGIVQFPSFHMVLGIILTYAVRGMPILFLAFLELNVLLFLSTPSIGGHHFADLWGGIVVALAAILAVKKAYTLGAQST